MWSHLKMAAASLLVPDSQLFGARVRLFPGYQGGAWSTRSYYQVSDFAGRKGGFAGHAPGVQDDHLTWRHVFQGQKVVLYASK